MCIRDSYISYDDFAAYKKDMLSYDGAGYGVPFDTGVAGLFYRTEMCIRDRAKVDVAYSNTNVTLIGISGGISYGALGMSHHSAQDIAAMSAIPNMSCLLYTSRCV